MHSTRGPLGRKFAALTSVLMLASVFAGCAGQSQNALPTANTQGASERPIATFMIDRSTAAATAAKVTSAGAYKLPLRGEAMAPAPAQVRTTLARQSRYQLSYYGGPTLSSATIYNIYVNNTATYRGDPGSFFTN